MSKPIEIEHIRCFSCPNPIRVDMSPVSIDFPGKGRQLVSPKFDAPLICETCREDPIKLKNARNEMFKYIGQAQQREAFDE